MAAWRTSPPYRCASRLVTSPDPLLAVPIDGGPPPLPSPHVPVVLIASMSTGGAERIVLDWIRAWRSPVRLVTLWTGVSEFPLPAHVERTSFDGKNIEQRLAELAARLQNERYPYALACHLIRAEHMAVLWNHGIRTVPVVHNMPEGWLFEPGALPALSVPRIVGCAQRVTREIMARTRIPATTLRHVPAGAAAVDAAKRMQLRDWLQAGDNALVIGAVGSFKAQKAYPRLAEVLAALAAAPMLPPVRLVIAGSWTFAEGRAQCAELLARALELGVRDRVHLCGPVHDVPALLAGIDVFVNVSHYEGLSIATAEALAAGVPCVVTDVGAQREHPRAKGALTLMPGPFDAALFATAIRAAAMRGCREASRYKGNALEWTLTTRLPHTAPAREGVLFVTANLNVGGAQRSLTQLAAPLATRMPVEIICSHGTTFGGFTGVLRETAVPVHQAATTTRPYDVAAGIMARVAETGIATIVFWNADPRVKLLVAKWLGGLVRLIDVSPGPALFAEMAASHEFQEIIAFSADDYYASLDVLVHKYAGAMNDAPGARQQVVIANGVALQYLTPSSEASEEGRDGGVPAVDNARPHPRILIAGRIHPDKFVLECVESLREILAAHPQAELVIAGDAQVRNANYLEAVRAAAAPFGHHVRMTGATSDVASLMRGADMLLLVSRNQGCPNTLLEAMAAGLPVAANADGGAAELLGEGARGEVIVADLSTVAPGVPGRQVSAAIADAVLRALRDPSRMHQRADAAREHVAIHHSLEEMIDGYAKLFAR